MQRTLVHFIVMYPRGKPEDDAEKSSVRCVSLLGALK